MTTNLLILGGTTEAAALAKAVAGAGITAALSLAGRVARPAQSPLPQRIGGFGGVAGLVEYLRENRVTHLVDATHPFAAQMSANAIAACAQTGVPCIALTRPAWAARPGDNWITVPDIAGAVSALNRPRAQVFLAVGRMYLAAFAPNAQHRYVLRLVDPPSAPLPLPDAQVIVARGPFSEADDLALMRAHGIELVVSKNAGGTGAYAKIVAARQLGLPVIMIDRPVLPARQEVETVDQVMGWLDHTATDRGV